MALQFPVALIVAVTLSVSLLTTAAPATSGAPQPFVANSTIVAVPYLAEAFLFCWADPATDVQELQWRNASDAPLPPWTPGAAAFQLGSGRHVPHAYLVLADFREDLAGMYTCVARDEMGREGRVSVTVKLDDSAPWLSR